MSRRKPSKVLASMMELQDVLSVPPLDPVSFTPLDHDEVFRLWHLDKGNKDKDGKARNTKGRGRGKRFRARFVFVTLPPFTNGYLYNQTTMTATATGATTGSAGDAVKAATCGTTLATRGAPLPVETGAQAAEAVAAGRAAIWIWLTSPRPRSSSALTRAAWD